MRQSEINPGDIFSIRPASLDRATPPPWALTGDRRPATDWGADLAGLAVFDEILLKVVQAGVPHGPTERRIGVWGTVVGGFHHAPGEGITLVPTRDLELVVAAAALHPAPESVRRKGVIPGTERFVG